MSNKEEGWTWLHNATKWHYFRNGQSLCGRYMLFVHPEEGYEQGGDDSADNCAACKRKRLKELENDTEG
jgi:hypothetical protein